MLPLVVIVKSLTIQIMTKMAKEIIKMYPYYSLQLSNSSYKIIKLDVVEKQFEELDAIYTTKEDCDAEVKNMNMESGHIEFEYEI